MFCLCVCAVTCEEEASVPLPEGLVLVEDFVSPEEEAQLLAAIDWSSANDDITGEGLRNSSVEMMQAKSPAFQI